MLRIVKNPRLQPPQSLLNQYRQSDDINKSYKNSPTNVKDEIRDCLLEEQGFLCAYCMSRISFGSMRIEHFLCQDHNPEYSLEYSNMLGCCCGGESEKNKNKHDNLHCDVSKRNTAISINPLNVNPSVDQIIRYSKTGKISTTDERYTNDIETTLNLNYTRLCRNREETYEKMMNSLKSFNFALANVRKALDNFQTKNAAGKLPEYAGVAIFFLSKILSKRI